MTVDHTHPRIFRAAVDIPPGDWALKVPASLLLHAALALRDPTWGPDFALLARTERDPRVLLALLLLLERRRGSRSAWHPYIAALPTTYDDPHGWWSEDALTAIRGTRLGSAVTAQQTTLHRIQAAATRLVTIRRERLRIEREVHGATNETGAWLAGVAGTASGLYAEGEDGPGMEGAEAAKWAHSTVWSRAFNLHRLQISGLGPGMDVGWLETTVAEGQRAENITKTETENDTGDGDAAGGGGDDVHGDRGGDGSANSSGQTTTTTTTKMLFGAIALVPVVDMLDHDASHSAAWHLGPHGADPFHMVTRTGRLRGEQLFNHYGRKSNEEFILGYGFAIADNPFDFVHVAPRFRGGETAAARDLLLARAGLNPRRGVYITRRDPVPENLVNIIRIALMRDRQVVELVSAALNRALGGEEEPGRGRAEDDEDGTRTRTTRSSSPNSPTITTTPSCTPIPGGLSPPTNVPAPERNKEADPSAMINAFAVETGEETKPTTSRAPQDAHLILRCDIGTEFQVLDVISAHLDGIWTSLGGLPGRKWGEEMTENGDEVAAIQTAHDQGQMDLYQALLYRQGQKEIIAFAQGELQRRRSWLLTALTQARIWSKCTLDQSHQREHSHYHNVDVDDDPIHKYPDAPLYDREDQYDESNRRRNGPDIPGIARPNPVSSSSSTFPNTIEVLELARSREGECAVSRAALPALRRAMWVSLRTHTRRVLRDHLPRTSTSYGDVGRVLDAVGLDLPWFAAGVGRGADSSANVAHAVATMAIELTNVQADHTTSNSHSPSSPSKNGAAAAAACLARVQAAREAWLTACVSPIDELGSGFRMVGLSQDKWEKVGDEAAAQWVSTVDAMVRFAWGDKRRRVEARRAYKSSLQAQRRNIATSKGMRTKAQGKDGDKDTDPLSPRYSSSRCAMQLRVLDEELGVLRDGKGRKRKRVKDET